MALFGSKKNTAKKVTPKTNGKGGLADVVKTISDTPATKGKKASSPAVMGVRNVLKKPRITEKAANLTVQNVYTFDVVPGASKHDIVRAVQALYKVTPRKVTVVNTKGKKVSLRTRRGFGVKNANRKAYIFLKEGDKIDFAS
jgi:large subunit ribosomal protein L23